MSGVETLDFIVARAQAIQEYLRTLELYHIYDLMEVIDVDYNKTMQTKHITELVMLDLNVANLKVREELSIPLQKALELAREYHRQEKIVLPPKLRIRQYATHSEAEELEVFTAVINHFINNPLVYLKNGKSVAYSSNSQGYKITIGMIGTFLSYAGPHIINYNFQLPYMPKFRKLGVSEELLKLYDNNNYSALCASFREEANLVCLFVRQFLKGIQNKDRAILSTINYNLSTQLSIPPSNVVHQVATPYVNPTSEMEEEEYTSIDESPELSPLRQENLPIESIPETRPHIRFEEGLTDSFLH